MRGAFWVCTMLEVLVKELSEESEVHTATSTEALQHEGQPKVAPIQESAINKLQMWDRVVLMQRCCEFVK